MKQNSNYAGNLAEEMEEAGKLVPEEENMNVPVTSTATCNAFLTIYCC